MDKVSLGKQFIEQKIHCAQQVRQAWFHLGDKNNRYFQKMDTTRKRQNTNWKLKDDGDNWFKDQEKISQIINKVF